MSKTARPFSWIWLLAALGLLLGPPPLHAEGSYAYSTYLGGSYRDHGYDIATTPSGNVYIALVIKSEDFLELTEPPLGPPPYAWDIAQQVVVVALDPAGRLLYSAPVFLSSPYNGLEVGGIAATPDGAVVVAGTFSVSGSSYGFYARISRSGTVGVWDFLDYWANTRSEDVTVDAAGNFYISGTVWGSSPRIQPPLQGASAFVAKIGGGYRFIQIDSSGNDHGAAIAVDSAGNAIVAGDQDGDGFLAWVTPAGSVARWKTFGGSGRDNVTAIAMTPDGGFAVTGSTSSVDFPTLNPIQPALQGSRDVFLSRFSPGGELLASTYLGGSAIDVPYDLATGPDGALYLLSALQTHNPPEPAWESPLLSDDPDCRNALIARLDPEDFAVLDTDCVAHVQGASLAVDSAGWVSVTGTAWEDLELINPVQGFYAGYDDAFAVRMLMNRPPDCATATASPSLLWPPNGKLVPVSILGVTDPDGDPITLTVTGIRQDEPRAGGSVDASGVGTAHPWVRAQRSGGSDGRVYHIAFEALDDQGAVCTGEVTVCVPHDASGRSCGDGGALVDSTGR